LQRSTLFKDFVKILFNSALVDRLSVYLNVEAEASYNMMLDDFHEEKDTKLMGAVNKRAAEIFLNSGMFSLL